MVYRIALALGLLFLGACLGRGLSRPQAAPAAARNRRLRLPQNLLSTPMENVSVH